MTFSKCRWLWLSRCFGCPDEGLGALVVAVDVIADGHDELYLGGRLELPHPAMRHWEDVRFRDHGAYPFLQMAAGLQIPERKFPSIDTEDRG